LHSLEPWFSSLPKPFDMVRIDHHEYLTEEERRLREDKERTKYWKKWGPYVAERQWATGIITSIYTESRTLIVSRSS